MVNMNDEPVLDIFFEYNMNAMAPTAAYHFWCSYSRILSGNSSVRYRFEGNAITKDTHTSQMDAKGLMYYVSTHFYEDLLPTSTVSAYSEFDSNTHRKLPNLVEYNEEEFFQESVVWEHHFSPEMLRAFQIYVHNSVLHEDFQRSAKVRMDGTRILRYGEIIE